jgi:hypothetical protein
MESNTGGRREGAESVKEIEERKRGVIIPHQI